MKCPICQHENPDGVQFCTLCGQVVSSLAPVISRRKALMKCWSCHHDNPEGSQFCQSCGASLAQRPCHKCGTQNALTTIFCPTCGADLNKQLEKPRVGMNILKVVGCGVIGFIALVVIFIVGWIFTDTSTQY